MMQTFGLGEDFFQDPDLFIHDEKIISWMKEDIRSLSSELAKFERIKNFALKRTPFTIDDGEMTPTLKITRRVVAEKFAEAYRKLYKNEAGGYRTEGSKSTHQKIFV